jgi:hypothetical protein
MNRLKRLSLPYALLALYSEQPWDEAHFDVPWFQRRGQVPIPWE